MPSSPSYITQNRFGIFYFQYRVPTHFLNNGTKRKLFRLSLRTRVRRDALKQARKWAVKMDELGSRFFASPRDFGKAMELLMAYRKQESNNNWASVESFLMELGEDEEHLLQVAIDFDGVKKRENDAVTQENSFLKETIEFLKSKQSTSSAQSSNARFDSNAPLLSHLIESYIKDVSVGWDAKHFEGNDRDLRPRLESIVEIIGDKPCDTITREDVGRFKVITMNLPSNRKKKAAYRGKSIDELMEMSVPETDRLSPKSINKNLEKASSFFKWCKANSTFVTDELWHPLSRRVKDDVPDDEQRDAFTDEDLRKLFLSKQYLSGKHKEPSQHWIPLLGIFTGARENELCQLYRNDIYQDPESGIWVIDINDRSPDKKLKNKSHARIVPIHPTLLSLGFIRFVESVNSQRLFEELTQKRDGYQDAFSKWFNRTYRNKRHCDVGNLTGEKKNFHSFRHNVIDQLEKKEVPQPQVARLVGQTPADGSVTTIRYGKKNDVEANLKIIKKLEFPVDFKKIKPWC